MTEHTTNDHATPTGRDTRPAATKYGALRDGDGNPQDRWPVLAERISRTEPDIVLLNKVVDWGNHSYRQLARAMADLNLDVAPLPRFGSGYRSAILYNKDTVGRRQHCLDDKSRQAPTG